MARLKSQLPSLFQNCNLCGFYDASLNKVYVPNLENYRVQTDIFNFTLPENNILNLTSQTTHAVADGNWLFLKPPPAGTHELKVKVILMQLLQ